MQPKHHIIVNVKTERWIKGQFGPIELDNYTIEANVIDRRNVYYTLMREFGRCYGAIPMGYKFGKREKYADGTVGFLYSTVTIISGASAAKGFQLSD